MADYQLPDIGEGLVAAEIVKWFVQVGDTIREHEPLVEVMTDKATVEITAAFSGEIVSLGGNEGDTLAVGQILCTYNNSEYTSQTGTLKSKLQRPLAAPSVRKEARIRNIDLAMISGSGPKGRILLQDLQSSISASSSVIEPTENMAIRGVRKAIFDNMMKATSKAVLCTAMMKIQATALVKLRKEVRELPEYQNVPISYLPFIIKATAKALQQHPLLNASVDEEALIIQLHKNIHIGVAIATPAGLMVPVIRNTLQKSLLEIAMELQEIRIKMVENTLDRKDLTGSTFTVSSTGESGGIFATPIVNYPEAAILGVHAIVKEPIIVNDEIRIGQTLTMSCTFDHRIIDGAPAGAFMQEVSDLLENPLRLLT
ncbi:dihydrolipoamide acetyltransferase family protein [Kurthia sibirica]|nr:dihydrolipoamide acetyltransferase family protein [Kurthia sibirica]GEK35256.1 dihydrolipoamide acetyltransferase component of pyruvate dehydrogenase complex [Kurthia sibirica]